MALKWDEMVKCPFLFWVQEQEALKMMIVMLMAILVPSTPWPFPVLKNTKPGFSERCSSILNTAYNGEKVKHVMLCVGIGYEGADCEGGSVGMV